jgi:hypothetical protein
MPSGADASAVNPGREHGHGEDLLHGVFEPKECHRLFGRQVHGTDAAGALVLDEPRRRPARMRASLIQSMKSVSIDER